MKIELVGFSWNPDFIYSWNTYECCMYGASLKNKLRVNNINWDVILNENIGMKTSKNVTTRG